jgi:hypothetical protein
MRMAACAPMHARALAFLAPLLLAATPDRRGDGGTAAQDALGVVAPLLGRWVAEPDPRAPGVTGWTTFSRDLGDRVVVRRNHASYPAKEGKPASDHDDLMVIFAEDGRLRAEYFDSEGHVIRYDVQSPAPGTLVFLSEERPGTPRFRLTYAGLGTGTAALTFEIAPPGATAFRPYISARLGRER